MPETAQRSTAQRSLEDEIVSLAELAAEEGLSDLHDHIEGLRTCDWDFERVRTELERLTGRGGSVVPRASEALKRFNNLL